VPKIQWTDLPPALRGHLFARLRDRKISVEDLYQLKMWRAEPDAPDGLWYKDFGSFKICGDGQYPKTFLLRGQAAQGQKLRCPQPQAYVVLLGLDTFDALKSPKAVQRGIPYRAFERFQRNTSLTVDRLHRPHQHSPPHGDPPEDGRPIPSG
jgi:hypothetical protein